MIFTMIFSDISLDDVCLWTNECWIKKKTKQKGIVPCRIDNALKK